MYIFALILFKYVLTWLYLLQRVKTHFKKECTEYDIKLHLKYMHPYMLTIPTHTHTDMLTSTDIYIETYFPLHVFALLYLNKYTQRQKSL